MKDFTCTGSNLKTFANKKVISYISKELFCTEKAGNEFWKFRRNATVKPQYAVAII